MHGSHRTEQARAPVVHMHPVLHQEMHMKAKTTLLAALLVSAAAVPAFAQSAPPPTPRVETTTAPKVVSGQWRASKLIGVDVYNAGNEKIGDISEVLIDTTGKVTGVIVGVGGFLGIGQHDVLVTLDQLKFVNEPMRTTTTTTTTT